VRQARVLPGGDNGRSIGHDDAMDDTTPGGDAHVSTGRLPDADEVQRLVTEAHAQVAGVAGGQVSTVYPALARMSPDLFGVCVVGVRGAMHAAGDADHRFALMSVAKPFVLALMIEQYGFTRIRDLVGLNATGMAFNSIAAVDVSPDGRTNPMVNSGAIATASLAPGDTVDQRWAFVRDGICRFAGHELHLDDEVHESAADTNLVNRAIAEALNARGRVIGSPQDAVEIYTRQSSLSVTARDLAIMGATLADGGINPVTGERVITAPTCRLVLAVMTTAGLYETSGDWLCDVGLPGKSGIGGGIVTVSPGKGGLGTFAPPLDPAGNSVKGQLVAQMLSRSLGLDLLASAPPD
jgi:glutaminase